MSRTLKIIVTLSLALNLVLIGATAGHMGRFLMEGPPGPPKMFQDISNALPEDKRKLFSDAIARARKDAEPLRKQIDEARKEAKRLMTAETFNKEAYLRQVDKIGDLRKQVMQKMTRAMADVAEKSTPEERAKIAESISRFAGPRPPSGDRDPSDRPPPPSEL